MNTNSVFSSAINKMKATLVPVKDDKVRMTLNGDIACPSQGEYHAFVNGVLTNIPEELLIDAFPMYRISKPISQIVAGDIIKTTSPKTMKDGSVNEEGKFTYYKVRSVDQNTGKIRATSFSGTDSTKTMIQDFFLGQQTASVVVNLFGSMFNPQGGAQTPVAGGFMSQGMQNPMMMAMLLSDRKGDDDGIKSLLPFMMMQGGQANVMNNHMMAMMMLGGDKADMSDILMFSMMQNGGLANLFGTPVVAPVATATTTETPEAAPAAETQE